MNAYKQPLSDKEKNREINEARRLFFERLAALKKERGLILDEYRQTIEKTKGETLSNDYD
ncbi:hypothetical protein HZB06_03305 [Candidatus Wolfebacteria bacterium]|nr:hypothetical protein [Candidatus Wolfebacteria bacterium]